MATGTRSSAWLPTSATRRSIPSLSRGCSISLANTGSGRSMSGSIRSGTATAAMNAVWRVAAVRDPRLPVFETATLDTLFERSAAPRRLASRFALQLAGVAVLLTLIGVFAVAAAGVLDQSREIGIRAALGASRRDLVALVGRDMLWSTAWEVQSVCSPRWRSRRRCKRSCSASK